MKIDSFKIEEWMNKYEASAKYDLTTTCIKPLSLNELLQICNVSNEDIYNLSLGYGDITGSLRLKNAVKSLYEKQKIENITITHGAIGANQLVFLSLVEKDDEVISIVPTYQQHYSIPKSLGADVKLYFLKEENNWLPDINELSKLLSKKTKLICLNNPNNPTGAVIPNDMLQEIVSLAKENDIWVLSDEVYRGLNFTGNPYSKSIVDLYEKGISVGSMSKTYSLPGLRVGWVCANTDLIKEINHQRQYNTISVSALDDYYSALALENKEFIAKRNLDILKQGLNTLTSWAEKDSNVKLIIPNGGTTALVGYLKDISSRELCSLLQKETGVALLPGETLEMKGFVRIGFCAESLKEALILFSDYLKTI